MSAPDISRVPQLLGRFATGVAMVTARDPGGATVGMTASASRRCARAAAGIGLH